MYSKPSRILLTLAVLLNAVVTIGIFRPELAGQVRSRVADLVGREESSADSPEQDSTVPAPATTTSLRPTTTTSSTTTTTTTSTSTTTTTTSTTVPLTALEELARRAIDDEPAVESITDYWVPMLSQKWVGLDYEGIIYGPEEILDLDTSLRVGYGAVVLWTGNFTSFFRSDMWVHIVPEAYSSKEEVLEWCRYASLGRADCGAKIVSRTRGTKGSTAWQP